MKIGILLLLATLLTACAIVPLAPPFVDGPGPRHGRGHYAPVPVPLPPPPPFFPPGFPDSRHHH